MTSPQELSRLLEKFDIKCTCNDFYMGVNMNYEQALELATEKHGGQYRKNSGDEYIVHPIAVADNFDDEDRKIVAVLHDTIEDTDLTFYDLITKYGLNIKLCDALAALTRKPGQEYISYILGVEGNTIARDVKIADLRHNLSDLKNGSLRDKYLMALYILEN